MKERTQILISAVLGYIPFSVIFAYGSIHSIQVGLDSINGVIAANGIILGFWAAVVAIPRQSKLKEKKALVETGIILNLATLLGSVFSLVACLVGIETAWSALWVSVISFYMVCWALGITLHYTIFHNA